MAQRRVCETLAPGVSPTKELAQVTINPDRVHKWARAAVTATTVLFMALGAVWPSERASAGLPGCTEYFNFVPGFAAEANATLPANGGVLVLPTVRATRRRVPPPSRPAALSLVRAGRRIPVEQVDLAPGWSILRPAQPTSGTLTARLGSASRRFVFGPADNQPLPAPSTVSVSYVQPPHRADGMRSEPAQNTVRLGTPAPASAYAIVVRPVPAQGATSSPPGFALRLESQDQVEFRLGDRDFCGPPVPGAVVQTGTTVEVLYVDARGRLSAPQTVQVL